MIQAGVFDNFGIHRAALFTNLQKILDYVGSIKTSRLYGQSSLFASNQEEEFPPLKLDETPSWPDSLTLEYEKQLLGFFVSGHPLDKYREQWEKCITIDLGKPDHIVKDRMYNLFGMLKNLRVTMTKKGAKMAFAQLEDFQGTIELVLFPKFYEANESVLLNDTVIGIMGKADIRDDKVQIIAEGILNMEKMEKKALSEVHIRLHRNCSSEDELRTLCSQLFDHKGSCSVFIHTKDTRSSEMVIKASPQITVNPDDDTLDTIRDNPCVEEVWSL
jgi:DNA polymerase-3 subunit alpha